MRPAFALLAAVAAAALTGCAYDRTADSDIVAGFYPLAYAAERIAPDAVVRNITPAGTEPHDLELSPRDVEAIDEAEVVLYLGGGFMPALEDAARDHPSAVNLLDAVATRGRDPHVWLDPRRYAAIARRIAGALGEQEATAGELVAELESLDAEFRAGLANCERRTIVTSHAAFGYLADAYDLEQVALTGLSPEAEPGARSLERLVAAVERSDARVVFFETLVSPDLARTVAREAGVASGVLNPIEGLTEEELDAGEDYFSLMRANLAALRQALGCA